MRKRLWSILLVLCMMLSLLPIGASAAKVVDSGKCGDNLTWTLTDDGVLTISGMGTMTDFDEIGPWYDNSDIIEKVIIESGVTTIGSFAFDGCAKIKSISIPNTVVSIGDLAFLACSSLPSIEIPSSVTSIGYGVFDGCVNLTSIIVDAKNDNYKSVQGMLFADAGKTLVRCPEGKSGTIRIPDGVTSIGARAFSYCENLTDVMIPDGVTSIGGYAFTYCSKLSSVTLPKGIREIPAGLFSYCRNLKSVTIPEGVTNIGSYAFDSCSSLTSVTIPKSTTVIKDDAFYDCSGLKSVTIPSSVVEIEEWAFSGCKALTDIYYSGTKEQWDKIKIGKRNDPLTTLTEKIHYESSGPDGAESTPAPTATPTFTVPNKKITLDEKQDVVMLKATLPYSDAAYLKSCMEKVDVVTADTMMKTAQKIVVAEDGKTAELIFTLDPYKAKSAQYNIWWDSDRLAGETVFVYGKEAQLDRKWEKSDQWSFSNNSGKEAKCFDTGDRGYYITSADYNRLIKNLSPYDARMIDYCAADEAKGTPASVYYNVDGNSHFFRKWKGSCLGMSVTSVLVFEDILKLSNQSEGRKVSQVQNNDNIRSGINFHQNFWNLAAWQNAYRDFMEKLTVAEQLEKMEHLIISGHPVVISYSGYDYVNNKSISHAVVAYAMENGPFTKTADGQTLSYQKKFCIYDCANPNDEEYDIYYTYGNVGVWCLPGHNFITTQTGLTDTDDVKERFPRYNNAALTIATNDIELLNAVSYKDGTISSAVVNAKLNSARLYALSDDAYTIKTKNGTVAMDGIRYKKTGMSDEKVTVAMAPNYTADGTAEPSQVTVFLPEKDSYTVSSDNLLSYGFADNNKAAFVNAGASGDIVFKPSCETSISADQKTEISVTAFNNESKAAWDSFTITAENADDLTVEPNDIVVKVSGDLEKAEIEITKNGKTTKEKLDTKDESISFTVLDGRVIPVDPSPTNTPAPSAQPTTAPSAQPSPEPSSKPVSTKFVDVADGAYYADAVRWAVNHDPQITNGMDSTHFAPNKECTRAQMVTFLWRAAGEPKPESTKNPFTDVKKGAYYYDAVLWAVEQGITTGTGKTTFSPDATVTRAQTVTFLWRMEGEPAVKTKNPFTDVKSGQYYTDAVLWAVKNNITNGLTATTFGPANPCTRAQIVTFLWRAMA